VESLMSGSQEWSAAGRSIVIGSEIRPCTLVILSSETALGEPLTPSEGTSRRGSIRGPKRGIAREGNRRPCTPDLLFTDDGPGGAVVAAGVEVQGLIGWVPGTSVVGEAEGREGRQGFVTPTIQVIDRNWTWEEPTGAAE